VGSGWLTMALCPLEEMRCHGVQSGSDLFERASDQRRLCDFVRRRVSAQDASSLDLPTQQVHLILFGAAGAPGRNPATSSRLRERRLAI